MDEVVTKVPSAVETGRQSAGRRGRAWTVGLILFGVLIVIFAANAGHMLVIDAPEKSDVILVLAGETDRRPARGLELLDQGYGHSVVIDVPAEAEVFGTSEVDLATKYFGHLPEAASVRICPITGLSTKDESHDAEKCLAHEEGARVLIVTSDFHTRRAVSIFRHEIRGKSFAIAAARDETQFGTHWWVHRQWAKTFLDEWLRLIWWNAVDRWR